MRRWISGLVVILMLLMTSAVANAGLVTNGPSLIDQTPTLGGKMVQVKPPIPVGFSAVPNRYTDVDPSTQFDLNGDLVADLTVSATTVTGKNGTTVQLLDPAQLSLDMVQTVPPSGYSASAAVQLSRVFVAKLTDGGYAKFMLLQTTPKVTIWFSYGMPTTSELKADGTGGHAVLTWTALPDATLGYNVYRYEFLDNNSYTVTLLNDFTVQETTYTDNTAQNHYYIYVVIAMKAGGAFGSPTSCIAVQVQSLQRSIVLSLTGGTAKLDNAPITIDSPPVIKNGRLMAPASLLTNAGVKVTVAGDQITLTRRLDNVTYTVTMTVNVPDYNWNGSAYKADVPPYLAGNVVMVPLRVVAPSLGYGLTFNSTDRTASIVWFE